jgi:hypothetical protein
MGVETDVNLLDYSELFLGFVQDFFQKRRVFERKGGFFPTLKREEIEKKLTGEKNKSEEVDFDVNTRGSLQRCGGFGRELEVDFRQKS